ncbi:activator of Hsp90 ATPase [Cyathus striatus]|nr:activator of Hsp90 ATPase [Cyathus striatus]
MALPPSTANWHWKNKNVTRWGTQWFEQELTSISVTGDKEGEVVSISKVNDVDGDIELGQRKSKLITIFDCKVTMNWEGTASDGTEVKGTVTIPEVSHEIICDGLTDYVYEWSLGTTRSPEVNSLFDLAKSRFPALIEEKLAAFPAAMIETHGRDIQVSADNTRSSTPVANASATAAAKTAGAVPAVKKVPKAVNTTTVVVDGNFQASADDLFSLLTDEKRIPAWTRRLLRCGVKGKYVSLTPPKEIVQTWALQSPTWPSGHDATLTTTLDQSSDSTKVTFHLSGVPLGMQDEIKRNIEGYYIHGFKSIGLGSEL